MACPLRGVLDCMLAFTNALLTTNEFLCCHTNILCNLSQQWWRDIAGLVKWNGSTTPFRIPELLVRSSLHYFNETQAQQNSNHIRGLENW